MSISIKPGSNGSNNGSPITNNLATLSAAQGPNKLPTNTGTFAPSSLGRSYVTPDSSVSPGLAPREKNVQRAQLHDAGDDDTDDLYMDGLDDEDDADATRDRSEEGKDGDDALIEEDPATSPATLADTYLPALFAQHGPCAIRHLTQYLALNNNKFGSLELTKQRRLVVKALELRKGTMYEKVGWGRWNIIETRSPGIFTPESLPVKKDSSSLSGSLRSSSIPGMPQRGLDNYPQPSSYAQEFLFSPSLSINGHNEHQEDDVDFDPLDLDMDEDSATDEEDWKSIGAQALRSRASPAIPTQGAQSGSYSSSPRHTGPYPIRRKSGTAGIYQMKSPATHPYSPSFSKSPAFSRASFPKSSSYLKSAPISLSRNSSFSTIRESKPDQSQSPQSHPATNASRGPDAEAVEALFMLSGSYERSK